MSREQFHQGRTNGGGNGAPAGTPALWRSVADSAGSGPAATISTRPPQSVSRTRDVHVHVSLTIPAWLARLRLLRWLAPFLAFVSVGGYFALRSLTQVTPEGDSTLHLHLMEVIANGDLPRTLPYFAAVVGPGGQVQEYFPYGYPLLYHLIGGGMFWIGGESLAVMLGPLCAGFSGAGVVYLLRDQPWQLRALAIGLAFLQWITQPVMTWVYMEPMMLAFFIGGLCFYQRAWSGGNSRDAVIAGLFFGLAVATRQNALFGLLFVGMHAALTFAGRLWFAVGDVKAFVKSCGAMFGTAVLVALPFLAYLVWNTGTLGYADVSVPGFEATLPADPEAVEYLRSFSVPRSGPIEWADQFWNWTLYTTRWQVGVLTYIPLPFFVLGLIHLGRQGRTGTFLATYVPIHILGEMTQLMTVHGNWRYVVTSRVLFYVVVAAGVYFLTSRIYRAVRQRMAAQPAAAWAAAALTVAAIAPGFVTPGLLGYLANQEDGRAEKGESFRELGDYVEEHVPEDALILSGRWYTTGYYLRRDYTWVTYYGNLWVVDAISVEDPATVRATLDRYDIDYIVFQAPPPTYLDAMPSGGLRTIVLEDLDHFQLLFKNERTRLYRFWPDGIVYEDQETDVEGRNG